MMDEEYRIVKPYGQLYTQGHEYFLLMPCPVVGDSWERDGTYRFLVTPVEPIAVEQKGADVYQTYDYPRHVITNSFALEIKDEQEIHIPQAYIPISCHEDEDKKEKINVTQDEEDGFPF